MANWEHLEILNKGVPAWNRWRKENPAIRPELGEANLRGAELTEVDFSRADLSDTVLRFAKLSEANLGATNLREAKLREAELNGASLLKAHLVDADLAGADLRGAKFNEAVLCWANLSEADLSSADLSRANLIGVNLRGADLNGANLVGADLSAASLNDANLLGADLTDSKMGYTVVTDLDLSVVNGLETVRHEGPSSVGIDTIYKSKGKIPEVFLRGAGVPEPFIREMRALVNAMEPIQFYSCFISYSSKDGEFAERLHADLQSKNVRCWFDREDMKIGDRIRPRIDEAIRVHDKLLLVLTENSMKSPWVEKEVETAFEKERRQGRTVLFPIRLDDAVMGAEEAWAADIRRSRHIGDFCGWKEHDKYRVAFERLMRDLRAEEGRK